MKYEMRIEGGCWGFDTPKKIKSYKKSLEKYGFEILQGKVACTAKNEQYRSTDGKMVKYRIRGTPVIDLKTIKQLNQLKKDLGALRFEPEDNTIVLVDWD